MLLHALGKARQGMERHISPRNLQGTRPWKTQQETEAITTQKQLDGIGGEPLPMMSGQLSAFCATQKDRTSQDTDSHGRAVPCLCQQWTLENTAHSIKWTPGSGWKSMSRAGNTPVLSWENHPPAKQSRQEIPGLSPGSASRMMPGMGFSKPKAVTPTVTPPPVTATGADVAAAADQTRQDQRKRQGYASTMTLLQPSSSGTGKKTLLGGN